jgi:hypothetical protein
MVGSWILLNKSYILCKSPFKIKVLFSGFGEREEYWIAQYFEKELWKLAEEKKAIILQQFEFWMLMN